MKSFRVFMIVATFICLIGPNERCAATDPVDGGGGTTTAATTLGAPTTINGNAAAATTLAPSATINGATDTIDGATNTTRDIYIMSLANLTKDDITMELLNSHSGPELMTLNVTELVKTDRIVEIAVEHLKTECERSPELVYGRSYRPQVRLALGLLITLSEPPHAMDDLALLLLYDSPGWIMEDETEHLYNATNSLPDEPKFCSDAAASLYHKLKMILSGKNSTTFSSPVMSGIPISEMSSSLKTTDKTTILTTASPDSLKKQIWMDAQAREVNSFFKNEDWAVQKVLINGRDIEDIAAGSNALAANFADITSISSYLCTFGRRAIIDKILQGNIAEQKKTLLTHPGWASVLTIEQIDKMKDVTLNEEEKKKLFKQRWGFPRAVKLHQTSLLDDETKSRFIQGLTPTQRRERFTTEDIDSYLLNRTDWTEEQMSVIADIVFDLTGQELMDPLHISLDVDTLYMNSAGVAKGIEDIVLSPTLSPKHARILLDKYAYFDQDYQSNPLGLTALAPILHFLDNITYLSDEALAIAIGPMMKRSAIRTALMQERSKAGWWREVDEQKTYEVELKRALAKKLLDALMEKDSSTGVTCLALRQLGDYVVFAMHGGSNQPRLSDSELLDCLEFLGRRNGWSLEGLQFLTSLLPGAVKRWTSDLVERAGIILSAFSDEEFAKLPWNTLKSFTKLFKLGGLSQTKRSAGITKWMTNRNKTAEQLTGTDLGTIGQFVCGLSAVDVSKLTKEAMSDSLSLVGEAVAHCSRDFKMAYIKRLQASGIELLDNNVTNWTPLIVIRLGNLLGGLEIESIKRLSLEQLEVIQPDVVRYLPLEFIKELTFYGITKLGSRQVNALSNEVVSALPAWKSSLLGQKADLPFQIIEKEWNNLRKEDFNFEMLNELFWPDTNKLNIFELVQSDGIVDMAVEHLKTECERSPQLVYELEYRPQVRQALGLLINSTLSMLLRWNVTSAKAMPRLALLLYDSPGWIVEADTELLYSALNSLPDEPKFCSDTAAFLFQKMQHKYAANDPTTFRLSVLSGMPISHMATSLKTANPNMKTQIWSDAQAQHLVKTFFNTEDWSGQKLLINGRDIEDIAAGSPNLAANFDDITSITPYLCMFRRRAIIDRILKTIPVSNLTKISLLTHKGWAQVLTIEQIEKIKDVTLNEEDMLKLSMHHWGFPRALKLMQTDLLNEDTKKWFIQGFTPTQIQEQFFGPKMTNSIMSVMESLLWGSTDERRSVFGEILVQATQAMLAKGEHINASSSGETVSHVQVNAEPGMIGLDFDRQGAIPLAIRLRDLSVSQMSLNALANATMLYISIVDNVIRSITGEKPVPAEGMDSWKLSILGHFASGLHEDSLKLFSPAAFVKNADDLVFAPSLTPGQARIILDKFQNHENGFNDNPWRLTVLAPILHFVNDITQLNDRALAIAVGPIVKRAAIRTACIQLRAKSDLWREVEQHKVWELTQKRAFAKKLLYAVMKKMSLDREVTCVALRQLGHYVVFALHGINPTPFIPDPQLLDCLEFLGRQNDWSTESLEYLKNRLERAVTVWTSDLVEQTGIILSAFSDAQFASLPWNTLKSFTKLFKLDGLSQTKRSTGITKWMTYRTKTAEQLTGTDLSTIGQFVCGLSAVDVSKLTKEAMSDSLSLVGEAVAPCDRDFKMAYIKRLQAAGIDLLDNNVANWTPLIVIRLGHLLGGLEIESVTSLTQVQLEVIQHDVMRYLPAEFIKGMNEIQVNYLDKRQANAISLEVFNALPASTKTILSKKADVPFAIRTTTTTTTTTTSKPSRDATTQPSGRRTPQPYKPKPKPTPAPTPAPLRPPAAATTAAPNKGGAEASENKASDTHPSALFVVTMLAVLVLGL